MFVSVHARARAHRCGLNVTVIVELEVLTAEAPARPAKECVAQTQAGKERKRIMEQMKMKWKKQRSIDTEE